MRELPSIKLGERGLFRGEVALYLLILLAAAGMRFWELDLRAFHYDESLHAFYSWRLFQGEGYQHNPLMHGPFQFISTALVYRLLGDSDLTSRLLPALAGSLVVLLPFFLRGRLGRGGGLLAASMLAFSPSLLYVSRFMRNEMYIDFLTLILVIALWRYMGEGRARYLYLGAAALGLSFATKEVSYITVAIWGVFLLALTAGEWLGLLRGRLRLSALSPGAAFLLVMAALSLPQASAGVSIFQKWLGVTLANPDATQGLEGAPLGWGLAVAGVVVGVFMAVSILAGFLWRPRQWMVCAAIFYGVYISLFTVLFTSRGGLGTGIWGAGYWLVQHGKHRMEQPWFYYPSLLSIYEFLPLVLAIGAAVFFLKRRSPFTTFLIYWLSMSLVVYTLVGEKAPWLVLHIALPLILLGAKFGGEVLAGSQGRWGRLSAVAVLVPLFALTLVAAGQASYSREDRPVQLLVFAQGSQDLPRLRDRVEGLAVSSGQGEELPITVDSNLAWPWKWYLRDFRNVDYPDLGVPDVRPRGSVLLVDIIHEGRLGPYLTEYGQGSGFDQIMWFPDDYKTWGTRDFFSAGPWQRWWGYFRHRTTPDPYISTGGKAFFPKERP